MKGKEVLSFTAFFIDSQQLKAASNTPIDVSILSVVSAKSKLQGSIYPREAQSRRPKKKNATLRVSGLNIYLPIHSISIPCEKSIP